VNGQVVFAIGELTKDITIPILVNTETEDDEIFYVDIATDCCAEITFGQVQVNITENGPDSESKPLILLTFLLHSSIHSFWRSPLYCSTNVRTDVVLFNTRISWASIQLD